jgi:hypothetical protein
LWGAAIQALERGNPEKACKFSSCFKNTLKTSDHFIVCLDCFTPQKAKSAGFAMTAFEVVCTICIYIWSGLTKNLFALIMLKFDLV